jgi:transaldolase
MSSPLRSLIATGTKLWLDSIDPDLVQSSFQLGATGATSNPVIVSNLIKTGRFDEPIQELLRQGLDDDAIAWQMTDSLVRSAQEVFHPIWQKTQGNDGYVSFEVDPLLEDPQQGLSHSARQARYLELATQWAKGHENRMIKVPATEAGIASLEEIAAQGITINVTLIFTPRQHRAACDAIWRGAQRHGNLDHFKSVYSIFISRLDVYTEEAVPQLSPEAQGMVGIVNAKRIWADNQKIWRDRGLKLEQEMIFASTGTKKPEDPPWKYIEAMAGSDIETNPPETNEAYEASGRTASRQVDTLPSAAVLDEIDAQVDPVDLEETLMREGIKKFADPQRALLALIADKRSALATAG